ncbi:MAG TPA: NAD(P)H-quinone oxidoreductase [Frankiaceae bacterium]|jgi:NADPH2:quinone reductase|nr:NAD(P)H-quinone oxidoreductase [Frankiaceae bacterium]
MRAVTFDRPGDPSVLRVAEVADPPAPGPGEVVLDVVATAVNRADLLQRMGFYAPPPGASDILGLECSGRVAAVGGGVELSPGQEVCALLAGGGYASKVLVPAGQVMPVPEGVSLIDAAALPETASTVWSNLLSTEPDEVGTSARLAGGETLLIHGGASGIGTMAIQLARALRPTSRIAVTTGTAVKLERCRELGADITIDYSDQDFVAELREQTGGHGADVVLDNMGAKYLVRNVDVLAPDGRIVVIGMQGGTRAEIDLGALLHKRGSVIATSLRGRPPEQKARVCAGVMREVWPAVAAGKIRPIVDRVLALENAAAAHQALDDSLHIGKVVLTI